MEDINRADADETNAKRKAAAAKLSAELKKSIEKSSVEAKNLTQSQYTEERRNVYNAAVDKTLNVRQSSPMEFDKLNKRTPKTQFRNFRADNDYLKKAYREQQAAQKLLSERRAALIEKKDKINQKAKTEFSGDNLLKLKQEQKELQNEIKQLDNRIKQGARTIRETSRNIAQNDRLESRYSSKTNLAVRRYVKKIYRINKRYTVQTSRKESVTRLHNALSGFTAITQYTSAAYIGQRLANKTAIGSFAVRTSQSVKSSQGVGDSLNSIISKEAVKSVSSAYTSYKDYAAKQKLKHSEHRLDKKLNDKLKRLQKGRSAAQRKKDDEKNNQHIGVPLAVVPSLTRYAIRQAIKKAKQAFVKSLQNKIKVQVYKAANAASQLIKRAVALLKKKSIAIAIGGLGGGFTVIVPTVSVVLVIAAAFSWTDSFTTTTYNESTGNYDTVTYEDEAEVIQGYINYIQNYFDDKQLEILTTIDYEYGGWEPDQRNYYRPITYELTAEERIKYAAAEYVEVCANYTENIQLVGDAATGNAATDNITNSCTSEPLYTIEYWFITEKYGRILHTNEANADFTTVTVHSTVGAKTALAKAVAKNNEKYNRSDTVDELYSISGVTDFSSGYVINNSSTVTITKKGTTDITTYYPLGSAVGNWNIYEYIEKIGWINVIPDDIENTTYTHDAGGTHGGGTIITYAYTGLTSIVKEYEEDVDETDRHILDLNQYGNKWIKLSDDCDIETIIALAAKKKNGTILTQLTQIILTIQTTITTLPMMT